MGGSPHRLHLLTRRFVRADLEENKEAAYEMGIRYARYWLDCASRYGGSWRNYQTFPRLETEWENLEAAADWLWETAAEQHGTIKNENAARQLMHMANALQGYLWVAGRWNERLQLSKRAYQLAHILNSGWHAGWRAYDAAFIQYSRAQTDDAAMWANRCKEAWTGQADEREQALVLRLRGMIARQRQDYSQAEQLLQEALERIRTTHYPFDVVINLVRLGALYQERGRYDAAEQRYQAAMQLALQITDKEAEAICSRRLGELALDRCQWQEARNKKRANGLTRHFLSRGPWDESNWSRKRN